MQTVAVTAHLSPEERRELERVASSSSRPTLDPDAGPAAGRRREKPSKPGAATATARLVAVRCRGRLPGPLFDQSAVFFWTGAEWIALLRLPNPLKLGGFLRLGRDAYGSLSISR
jgi:hypothetical protein